MNLILLGLGVIAGLLLLPVGEKLAKTYKGKSEWIPALLTVAPLAVFCLLVIVVDILA